jgi:hypothetical protein
MELVAVTADATGRPQSGRYREIADELRLLAPKTKYAEVAKQLRLLAISSTDSLNTPRSRALIDRRTIRGICQMVDGGAPQAELKREQARRAV